MTEEIPEIVSYSTFVRDLTSSKISEVNIYDYGRNVDLTYETLDGELRATKGPLGLDNDELLSFTLKSQEIPFTVHAEKYRGAGTTGDWMMHFGSFAFLLIPVLLILVILRQSKTISTLGAALARGPKLPAAEHGEGGKA
jgi:ATP-dependent Zn protease